MVHTILVDTNLTPCGELIRGGYQDGWPAGMPDPARHAGMAQTVPEPCPSGQSTRVSTPDTCPQLASTARAYGQQAQHVPDRPCRWTTTKNCMPYVRHGTLSQLGWAMSGMAQKPALELMKMKPSSCQKKEAILTKGSHAFISEKDKSKEKKMMGSLHET